MNTKIDLRHNYGIVLDTETANGLEDALPYDFGFAVVDSHGRIYETFSFVNSDIFLHEKDLMKSAYYAQKIPQYWKDIWNGDRKVATTYEIRKALLNKYKEYGCKFIGAYNANFDVRACNNVQRYTTKSKYRYFFPRGAEIWDIEKMAHDVIVSQPTYQQFCRDNGYMTNHKTPRPRETAEVVYRYITGNNGFDESHTGLEDVKIETAIMAHCVRQHKPMRKLCYARKKK